MNAMSKPGHRLAPVVAALDGPLVVVDVGAQALAHEAHVYQSLLACGIPVQVVGFEPQAERAAARRAIDGASTLILEAFVGDGGTYRFHEATTDASSSLFPLDRAVCASVASLANLYDGPGEMVATCRLDILLDGTGPVDFLKLDIEGAELMALQGAGAVLARSAVVQAETAFAAFRQGQPLFADVDILLRGAGFTLMRLHQPAMRPAATPSGAAGADRLMWADAVYFADEVTATDRSLLVQAIIADAVYGMRTVAERALAIYDSRHGTQLASRYIERPVASELMPASALTWRPSSDTLFWGFQQTNTALRSRPDIDRAVEECAAAGLAAHADRPKNWDGFLAVLHAVATTPRDHAVLDAGAERYSSFLPCLRDLGFSNLVGINTVFAASEQSGGILYRPGDVTGSDLPPASFGFIACLSVIEHGVDVRAFLHEQARLLRPGGFLFVSCDYWIEPMETSQHTAYGVPVKIFTETDLQAMIVEAAALGLALVGPADFSCVDRVVCWERFALHYTFANLLWQKT